MKIGSRIRIGKECLTHLCQLSSFYPSNNATVDTSYCGRINKSFSSYFCCMRGKFIVKWLDQIESQLCAKISVKIIFCLCMKGLMNVKKTVKASSYNGRAF